MVTSVDEFDVDSALLFLDQFEFLIDSFILDFFVAKLFDTLPSSWRLALSQCNVDDVGRLINPCLPSCSYSTVTLKCDSAEASSGSDRNNLSSPLPLSMLCYRKCCRQFQLNRKPKLNASKAVGCLIGPPRSDLGSVKNGRREACRNRIATKNIEDWPDDFNFETKASSGHSTKLPQQLRLHIKPKKQHEILCVCNLVDELCKELEIDQIVDIGAGQGHLARYLSFRSGLSVTCVEADSALVGRANEIDKKLLAVSKANNTLICKTQPETVEACGFKSSSILLPKHIAKKVENAKQVDQVPLLNLPYCLIGLHACGDLSCAVLRRAVADTQLKTVVSVGCCYMKLNGGLDKPGHFDYGPSEESELHDADGLSKGFPLSKRLIAKEAQLSYMSRELACHALEQFCEKFECDRDKLKIHCYRAILEKLIVTKFPEQSRLGLHGVKNAHKLSFAQYCGISLERFPNINITPEYIEEHQQFIHDAMCASDRVLAYYCLRLMIAPVVESVILWDRVMYLREKGLLADCFPLFDPLVSPRNLVVVGIRTV